MLKKDRLKLLIENKSSVEMTLYGRNHIRCTPVRLVGNILNYKLAHAIDRGSCKIHSVPVVAIHRLEVLK